MPDQVATYVKSATQVASGRRGVNWRSTRSAGRVAAGSLIVVRRMTPPRRTPCNPSSRISRSTVQRATGMPSRLSVSHLARHIDPVVVLVHPADLVFKLLIAQRLTTGRPIAGSVVGAGGDGRALTRQHRADRLDPPTQPIDRDMVGVLSNKPHEILCGRSSSAAKKPAAALRISLARRSSRISARNVRTSADS